jgi:germination protein YpeB
MVNQLSEKDKDNSELYLNILNEFGFNDNAKKISNNLENQENKQIVEETNSEIIENSAIIPNNNKSEIIENAEAVSQEKAKEKASAFIGVDKESLQFLSKTENNLSTYTFYNGDYTVSVTQKGGLVCSMLTSMYASEIKLSQKEALKKATEFLNKKGYTKVKESYYSTTDGICTINFAYYDMGITYYTDLIKVSVALDDGKITAFDATGYIMNHVNRSLPNNIKYTIDQGKALLKKDLKLISSKKVFIPTEWETEVYAYEYHCKASDGNEILVYIDPTTGEEAQILILLYTDGGVLTK